jgi:hypothetical protein
VVGRGPVPSPPQAAREAKRRREETEVRIAVAPMKGEVRGREGIQTPERTSYEVSYSSSNTKA